MIVSSFPTAPHTAYNPILVHCIQELESMAVLKIAFEHSDTLPSSYITVEREYFNGSTMFDLSSKIKYRFTDDVSLIGNFIDNGNLRIYYSVFNGLTGALIYKGIALNAVMNIGLDTSMDRYIGAFLTEFKTIRNYEGYERQLYVLGAEENRIYIDGVEQYNTMLQHFGFNVLGLGCISAQINENATDIYLTSNDDEVITSNDDEPIEIFDAVSGSGLNYVNISCDCIPRNPFYVRWINRIGGMDYWMFSRKQTINKNVKNKNTFQPVIIYNESTNGTDKLINIEAYETITFGAELLKSEDYYAISKMAYSPRVEYLSNNSWYEMVIDKFDESEDLSTTLKNIEFTFKLPTPNVQF